MNFQHIGICGIGLGAVLLLTSFTWSAMVPDQAVWSAEQAQAYDDAAAQLHDDSYDAELSPEKLAASEERFDEMKNKLSRAQAVQQTVPFYLRWAGLGVCALGIASILWARSQEG